MIYKNLLILTHNFPYDGGEQFIESEIKFWENSKFENIYILPESQNGKTRNYPDRIKIINGIENNGYKFIYLVKSLFSSLLLKEIKFLLFNNKNKFSIKNFGVAVKTYVNIIKQKERIAQAVSGLDAEICIYSYWSDVSTYAAYLLKRDKKVHCVISRAHGFDVYEDRRLNSYMPFKRNFSKDADKVFLLSQNALNYYEKKYNYDFSKLDIAQLGVEIPSLDRKYLKNNKVVRVLSLSYCLPIKRIDKIMSALVVFSQNNPDLLIDWVHIGGGLLFDKLTFDADKIMKKNKKLNIEFLGQLDNIDVKKYLSKYDFDVFINASESEGIPVSIMEAMSYGIPAIAPNIGGVSDLVKEDNGYLMSSQANLDEIEKGLYVILFSDNMIKYRENSIKIISERFNAEKNYKKFISIVEQHSKIDDEQV